MPKEIITRQMLTIATHKKSGKGHYVLQSMVAKRTKPNLLFAAQTLCGLVRPGKAYKSLHIVTPATVTCERCKQAFAKHEVRQSATPETKEKESTIVEKRSDFLDAITRTLFSGGDGQPDEGLIEQFETDIAGAIADNLEFGDITLKEFLNFFHAMLSKHGAKLRNIIILYQKTYGNLVLCRTTMERMKEDIYL